MNQREASDRLQFFSKKTVVICAAVIAVAAVLVLLLQANISHIIRWQVAKNISANIVEKKIPDSRFEVIFCGTGAPHYSADRGQPCLGVIAGGRLFMFDAGENAAGNLHEAAAPLEHLDTIFLTHLHSDHIAGLGETLHNGWLFGRKNPVAVIGPPGTKRVFNGFMEAYASDILDRRAINENQLPDSYAKIGTAQNIQIDSEEALIVYDNNGVVIRAFRVVHPSWDYAYGYRIDFRGKSIVVSGDTRYTAAIAKHGQGVDLLIHEALSVTLMTMAGEIMAEQSSTTVRPDRLEKIKSRHTPTLDVAKVAAQANAKSLLITHLTPAIPAIGILEDFFIRGMDEFYDGEITVARDGMRRIILE